MRIYSIRMLTALCFLLIGFSVQAKETTVIVRAKAKDAKFIGTSMAGALVLIKDAQTGEVLAKGVTAGTTGNTARIMQEPHERGKQISDDTAAKFEVTLDLNEPTFVTIEVHAPLSQKQSLVKSSTQVWLIPGKDIVGDGILFEVPGFAVDVLMPQTHERVKLKNGQATVEIKANIVMMCGCPLTPDGLWDANKYEVTALVRRNGESKGAMPLVFTGKTSTFAAELALDEEGVFEILVYAYDPVTGNTGVDKATVIVTE